MAMPVIEGFLAGIVFTHSSGKPMLLLASFTTSVGRAYSCGLISVLFNVLRMQIRRVCG